MMQVKKNWFFYIFLRKIGSYGFPETNLESKMVQENDEALPMTMNAKVDGIKQLDSFGMLVLKTCQVFNICRSTYYRHL